MESSFHFSFFSLLMAGIQLACGGTALSSAECLAFGGAPVRESSAPASGEKGGHWFRHPALGGNRLTEIPDGDSLRRIRWELVEEARRSIYLTTYQISDDQDSTDFAYLLCRKARDGVDVRMLVDSWGSQGFYRIAPGLRECGVRVLFFNPQKWAPQKVMQTSHHKLLMVDGERMVMGGSNYGRIYYEAHRDHGPWYDLDFRIEGPVACWYHRYFVDLWTRSAHEDLPMGDGMFGSPGRSSWYKNYLYRLGSLRACRPVRAGNSRVLPLVGEPYFSSRRPLLRAYLSAIAESRRTIQLYAPYFVPREEFADALVAAAKRGVKVTVLTNSEHSNDEAGVVIVGMLMKVRRLLQAGVEVRLWRKGVTLHRKGGVFDGRLAYFGSDNLDQRGQDYSAETSAFTDDGTAVARLAGEMDRDALESTPLKTEQVDRLIRQYSWWARTAARLVLRYL